MTPHYKYCIRMMENEGKKICNPNFKFHESDYPLVHKLLVYGMHDKQTASEMGIDLKKGLMISGHNGCGKTALMKLIHHCSNERFKPLIKFCKQIRNEFGRDGYEVIQRYSLDAYHYPGNKPKLHCFEDLGSESDVLHYGNNVNVMQEILTQRYELFNSDNMQTYVTTALNADQLEERYGARMRGCMREMFNMFYFDKDSPDKRR